MHVLGTAVGTMNKLIGQYGGRIVMVVPWDVYSELSKMKGLDTPNLRSLDIGRKLSHLPPFRRGEDVHGFTVFRDRASSDIDVVGLQHLGNPLI